MSKPLAVIFGAGEAGKAALKHTHNEYQVIGFADNAKDKQGSMLCNLPVLAPQDIAGSKATVVLIASEYAESIASQCQALALPQHIISLPARYIKPRHFGDDALFAANGIRLLGWVSGFLQAHQLRHYVDAGTLLGLYRDGVLIPWDDDLDIALHGDDVAALLALQTTFLDYLQANTGEQWQLTGYHNNTAQGAVPAGAVRALKLACVSAPDKWPLLDLFVKYINGEVMDYCLSSRMIRMPSRHFSQPQLVEYQGHTLMFPHDVEGYLSGHYGDWQTPKQDWALADLANATLLG